MDKNKDELNFPKFPDIDLHKVLKKIPNRFLLAAAAAKRARQIKDGGKTLTEITPNEPMSFIGVALKEICEGKIDITIQEELKKEEEILGELELSLEDELKKDKEKMKKESKKPKEGKSKKSKSLAA